MRMSGYGGLDSGGRVESPSSSPPTLPSSSFSSSSTGGISLIKVSGYGQFKLLLWKNWLRKKCAWGHTLCEFIIPLVFIMVLLSLRSAFTKQTVPLQYFDSP